MTVPDMSKPPAGDHGSDRYDYIQVTAPEGTPLPAWLTADIMPCQDCRANLFLTYLGNDKWQVLTAHDDGCPTMATIESSPAFFKCIKCGCRTPRDGGSNDMCWECQAK